MKKNNLLQILTLFILCSVILFLLYINIENLSFIVFSFIYDLMIKFNFPLLLMEDHNIDDITDSDWENYDGEYVTAKDRKIFAMKEKIEKRIERNENEFRKFISQDKVYSKLTKKEINNLLDAMDEKYRSRKSYHDILSVLPKDMHDRFIFFSGKSGC